MHALRVAPLQGATNLGCGRRDHPFHLSQSPGRWPGLGYAAPCGAVAGGITHFISRRPQAVGLGWAMPPRAGLWPTGSQLKMRHRKIRVSTIGPRLSAVVGDGSPCQLPSSKRAN